MSIQRLLVANRGEVACRIFKTAKMLGITTLAVFSDADADAPFVELADEAVRIGPGPAAESYLRTDAILAAAERMRADAVHPGYGFLAENAEFARACADAGLIFVGPPAPAIAAMGDKVVAKRLMIEAEVPVVPGFQAVDASLETLQAEGERLGTPLLVKAVAGGGGRGMRAVQDVAELPAALRSAAAEAKAAFANGQLFLERHVTGARHVEIQVIADQHGNVHHLGERECSVQRRHQKVIEEAPSPAVNPALRAEMGAAAVKAAKAVEYVGAGTVEFLLDDDGQFYFLEMNTRLQVEHPVTELVTGVDLVRLQLEAAEGRVIGSVPEWHRGHAIEARIYCEDPYAGFVPQLGTVARWQPATGAHIRIDDGIRSGSEVTPHYDAMVAKVIAYGDDREQARRRLVAAVRGSVLLGPTTNRGLLLALLDDPEFVAGDFKTDTLDARTLEADDAGPRPAVWALAAVLRSGAVSPGAWASTGAAQWPVELTCGELRHRVVLTAGADGEVTAVVGEDTCTVRICGQSGAEPHRSVWAELDGVRQHLAHTRCGHDALAIDDAGIAHTFVEPEPSAAHEASAAGDEVRTPMGGRVISVGVEVGDAVTQGQAVAVVEAMKMEHRITAPRDGTIATLAVGTADQVKAGQVLATLQPLSEAAGEDTSPKSTT